MIHAVSFSDALMTTDAEACLCGLLMQSNNLIDAVADVVSADDFSEPVYGRIYAAIVREASLGKAANPITLRAYFSDDEAMKALGGVSHLATLSGMVIPIRGVDLAKQVAELALRRRILTGLGESMNLANDPNTTNEQIVEAVDAALSNAANDQGDVSQLTGGQCLDELIRAFDDPQQGVSSVVIPSVDDLLGPMRPKQLIIGAARPGMGKTALAISYSIGAAMNGHGVLFISLEMSSHELAARMAADMCFDGQGGVLFEAIRDAKVRGNDLRKIMDARNMMQDMPLHVVDAGRLTIGRLNMIVRRYGRRLAARGQKLELVVVDYLQLVSPDVRRASNYEAVSEVSRGLKAIAKDHGVAVFALAQLSREVEKRPGRRPQLADLRDSGQIEQDADAVLFLTRDEYYHRLEEPEKDSPQRFEWERDLEAMRGRMDFICAKRRNGRTGSAQGQFHGAYQAVRG